MFKDRASRFVSYAFPVTSEQDVKVALLELKKEHPAARHFCYAYRINPLNEQWRANDDGEPSSSAGKPILGQIRSLELQCVLVVVVRYFGGTLLGVPGLINAYKSAAASALGNARVVEKEVTKSLLVSVSFEESGELMRWIKSNEVTYVVTKQNVSFEVVIEVGVGKLQRVEALFEEKSWSCRRI